MALHEKLAKEQTDLKQNDIRQTECLSKIRENVHKLQEQWRQRLDARERLARDIAEEQTNNLTSAVTQMNTTVSPLTEMALHQAPVQTKQKTAESSEEKIGFFSHSHETAQDKEIPPDNVPKTSE